jgi:hypothetical protein
MQDKDMIIPKSKFLIILLKEWHKEGLSCAELAIVQAVKDTE